MKQPVVLVTGSNGQVGKELQQLAEKYPQFRFVFASREDLPLHHFGLAENFFIGIHPQYCINCAAYTAVDKAELEKELAFLVNAESVGVLAAVSHLHKTKFIHISTDYVYDGLATVPYTENAITDPQSVYGLSKKMGEEEAIKNNPDSIVIRTSWVYSWHGNNFVKTMMRLMNEKESISVVSDQRGTPTWAADLASAIMSIINANNWVPGIFNFSNSGETTWYDFAIEIKRLIGSKCIVNSIPTSSYPTPAKRPQYSVLDKEKIISVYHLKLSEWRESLRKCIEGV